MKIVLRVGIGMCEVRDEIEIPDEEWAAMSPKEREAECEAYLEGHVSNYVEASWWPSEEQG